jgi:hypothetical protein
MEIFRQARGVVHAGSGIDAGDTDGDGREAAANSVLVERPRGRPKTPARVASAASANTGRQATRRGGAPSCAGARAPRGRQPVLELDPERERGPMESRRRRRSPRRAMACAPKWEREEAASRLLVAGGAGFIGSTLRAAPPRARIPRTRVRGLDIAHLRGSLDRETRGALPGGARASSSRADIADRVTRR